MCPDLKINQDNYDLTQSKNETLDEKTWDAEIDLCLNKFTGNPFIIGSGKVLGVVKDKNNKRIENATVILMTNQAEVVFQNKSDASGEYLIDNIPKGNYFLIAKQNGKKEQKTGVFFIAPLLTIKRDFLLEDNAPVLIGVIVGSVLGAGIALVGAAVAIYYLGTLVATGVTGAGGAFAFGGLVAGAAYLVSIFKPGFVPQQFQQTAKNPEDIDNDNSEDDEHDLDIDYSFACTVSGIITDNNSLPINRADVILYKVELNNNLYPIAFMKTNKEGLYLFKVPLGKYIIKSTQNTTLKID